MAENSHGSEQNDALARALAAFMKLCFIVELMDIFHVKHRYVYRDMFGTCSENLGE